MAQEPDSDDEIGTDGEEEVDVNADVVMENLAAGREVVDQQTKVVL